MATKRKRPRLAFAHANVREGAGGVFAAMTGAVLIPLLFIKGTELNKGALPYFLVALVASAVIFVLSWIADRRERSRSAPHDASTLAIPRLVFVNQDKALAHTFTRTLMDSALVVGASGMAAPFPQLVGSAVAGDSGHRADASRQLPEPSMPVPVPNEYARVAIKNESAPGQPGATAENTAAHIEFLGENSTLLLEMDGRWAGTDQRAETGRLRLGAEESQLDIHANGFPHPLDVAMKVPGDTGFYAFNHENSEAPDLRLARHRMEVADCHVRVTVRASNAPPITEMFVLRNRDGLTVDPRPSATDELRAIRRDGEELRQALTGLHASERGPFEAPVKALQARVIRVLTEEAPECLSTVRDLPDFLESVWCEVPMKPGTPFVAEYLDLLLEAIDDAIHHLARLA